ncbi:phage tail terminator-like protein [uncultured Endozoicomonas sp.]|uniref:phage tail terminator-like protein n=1 Tax=uncultured Endozoicomonas sp. TaxID=432652 RepID=UPI00262A5EA5|nr:phage tail terminator-like protein [uncultured Endozoicomonas sp.]
MLSPVYSALSSHLTGLDLGLPIAWENVTPPDKVGAWLAVMFIPAETVGSTLGDGGLDESTGFYQVDAYAPTGEGWAELHSYADQVQRHFKNGLLLSHNGQAVQITSSSRTGGRVENGWYRLTLTINWRSYSQR